MTQLTNPQPNPATLATAVFPRQSIWRDMLLLLSGTLLIALTAQIKIPIGVVPNL